MNIQKYVAGFLFSEDGSQVLLIRKERPAWQRGRWNAIGGHIELGESPHKAMVREFEEETGVRHSDWNTLCALRGDGWVVYFFYAFARAGEFYAYENKTDETVLHFSVDMLTNRSCKEALMTNIPWLAHMALSMSKERADFFEINELYPPVAKESEVRIAA